MYGEFTLSCGASPICERPGKHHARDPRGSANLTRAQPTRENGFAIGAVIKPYKAPGYLCDACGKKPTRKADSSQPWKAPDKLWKKGKQQQAKAAVEELNDKSQSEDTGKGKYSDLVQRVSPEVFAKIAAVHSGRTGGKPRCFKCDKEGHFKGDFPRLKRLKASNGKGQGGKG